MKFDFSNDEDFKNHLREKETEIYQKTKDGIQEHENFRRLQGLFVSYKNERNINDFTVVLIEKSEIENLCDDAQDKIFDTLDSHEARTNNHLVINRNLEIVSYERKELDSSDTARKLYMELSVDFCVFLITPQPLLHFIDRNWVGKNLFLTQADYEAHVRLRSMSEINQVFDEYQEHLKNRDTYRKFFIANATKRSLYQHYVNNIPEFGESEEDFLKNKVQILRNSPEKAFQDDLKSFLKENLNITIGKEYLLEDLRRLDIVIIDNEFGDLYFIEVKWVGQSINSKGQDLSTRAYSAEDINPDAVIQSVEYIKKLFEEKQKIKIGYLAVFDARDEDFPDTLEDFDYEEINEDLKPYYPKFYKINDFRVKNYHPF